MTKSIRWVLVGIGVIILTIFLLQKWVNNKVYVKISNKDSIQLEKCSISLFNRCATLKNLQFKDTNAKNGSELTLQASFIKFDNISFWDYLTKQEISYENVKIDSLRIKKKNGAQKISIEEINFSNGIMDIENLFLDSPYEPTDFASKTKDLNSILELKIPQLKIIGFIPEMLIDSNSIFADSIIIQNPDLKIFEDEIVEECASCTKHFPIEVLKQISTPIGIPIIQVINGKVTYNHINAETDKIASLPFKNVYCSMYNVTNEIEKIKKNNICNVAVLATMLESTQVNVNFNFDLRGKGEKFSMDGNIEPFDLKDLNSFINLANKVSIDEGSSEKIIYKGNYNGNVVAGDMSFEYRDLKIAILKDDMSDKKFLSKIINIILTRDQNPPAGKLRIGKMYLERNEKKSFFFHWVKSVLSGLASVVLPNTILPKELKHEKVENN